MARAYNPEKDFELHNYYFGSTPGDVQALKNLRFLLNQRNPPTYTNQQLQNIIGFSFGGESYIPQTISFTLLFRKNTHCPRTLLLDQLPFSAPIFPLTRRPIKYHV